MELKKISVVNASLKPLIDSLLEWRSRLIPAGFPTYNLPNFPAPKAREISGEPSKRYLRILSDLQKSLSKGIRQSCDTEIILRKGYDFWASKGQYRIKWANDMTVELNEGNQDTSSNNTTDEDEAPPRD